MFVLTVMGKGAKMSSQGLRSTSLGEGEVIKSMFVGYLNVTPLTS